MQDKDNKRTKYRFLNVLHKIFLSKMYMSYFHFNLKIDVNGSLTTNASYEDRRGDPSTIMTMFCPVAELARFTRPVEDGIFITGYRISISNDGRNFGEEEDVFIFNSTFQNFEVIDEELKFTLKVLRFCCLFFQIWPYMMNTVVLKINMKFFQQFSEIYFNMIYFCLIIDIQVKLTINQL